MRSQLGGASGSSMRLISRTMLRICDRIIEAEPGCSASHTMPTGQPAMTRRQLSARSDSPGLRQTSRSAGSGYSRTSFSVSCACHARSTVGHYGRPTFACDGSTS